MDVGGYSTDERLARLGGVGGGMVAAATLTIAIVKLFAM